MILDCIRHGITSDNLENRFNGRSSAGLTTEQVDALRKIRIDVARYDQVFSSPAPRCLETARLLGIEQPRIDERIIERHFGVFEGRTPEECEATHAEDFAAFQRFDRDTAMPGGESRGAHHERLNTWLHELVDAERVLVVTHGGTIDYLKRLAAAKPLYDFSDAIMAGQHAALTRFEVGEGKVKLLLEDEALAGFSLRHSSQ